MSHSLLIVEDDADQLDILQILFKRADYQVVGVSRPRLALNAAADRQFQVAILDGSMPEMDGFELAQRLQQSQQQLQVIVLSGSQFADRPELTGKVFACLSKPCRCEVLRATVEEACEHSFNAESEPRFSRIRS